MEIEGAILVRVACGRVAAEVVEDGEGCLWLVDLLDGRRVGRVSIHDLGEVFVEEAGCWFVGGLLPHGATTVDLTAPQDAEVSVGERAWVAVVASAPGERRMLVAFRAATGQLLTSLVVDLPKIEQAASSRLGRRLTQRWKRTKRGRVRYGPR